MKTNPPRDWIRESLQLIDADFQRSADTHLIPLRLEGFPAVWFYLKDESSHPTGSLKHRLARCLFLYALVHGWLRPGAPVIEASSGSTAVSEAYFARVLGGRPRVEASFLPEVLDAMVKVPDGLSFGALHWLSDRLGRRVGPSTGSNFVGALAAALDLGERPGSVVLVLCDGGERYAETAGNPAWLADQGFDVAAARKVIEELALRRGPWPPEAEPTWLPGTPILR